MSALGAGPALAVTDSTFEPPSESKSTNNLKSPAVDGVKDTTTVAELAGGMDPGIPVTANGGARLAASTKGPSTDTLE